MSRNEGTLSFASDWFNVILNGMEDYQCVNIRRNQITDSVKIRIV